MSDITAAIAGATAAASSPEVAFVVAGATDVSSDSFELHPNVKIDAISTVPKTRAPALVML